MNISGVVNFLSSPSDAGQTESFLQDWAKDRVSWKQIHGTFEVPKRPGLYLWYSDADIDCRNVLVPRKVGQGGGGTDRSPRPSLRTLDSRMERYVPRRETRRDSCAGTFQCALACSHRSSILDATRRPTTAVYTASVDQILDQGAAVVPHSSNPRRRGAVDFALHGGEDLHHLFITMVSVDPEQRATLHTWETQLQERFDDRNEEYGLPRTVNG